ncbi:MAG: RNA polymerase factor sigma-54 [Proteobacteria bacterium]|nr:RNA polymerase factor sigma-54 [Pseudomonadota bacterium]
MKNSLQLKISQQLTLTPQLQQSIRLLQLSTLELQQEIKQLIQDNPLLEMEDDEEDQTPISDLAVTPSSENASPDDESTSDVEWLPEDRQESYGKPHQDSQTEETQLISNEVSLYDHLNEQLSLAKVDQKNKQIIMYLIGNLDEDGFLKDDINELLHTLPAELQIEQEEMQIALKQLQNLAPPGVASRNLSECLELQLTAMPDDTPLKSMAITLVKDNLTILASRDYNRLKKIFKCDDETLREVKKLIQSLNPRPGSAFSISDTKYISPDVFVRKNNGKWTAFLNNETKPRLKINKIYADILQNNKGRKYQNIKDQLTDAKWFIKNIEQRYETILRVSQAIVDQQHRFFEHGDLGMRPLVLREIAEKLDLHESTISRVTTQKYMMTPRGILELKYFFGSHVTTESGSAYSSTAIRALIKNIVDEEDKRKPASDSQISKLLSSQGIVVARRTVAKYREALQILPVNLRKDL